MNARGELVERLRRSLVQVANGNGGGAGVVWDAKGAVVTNAHVLRGRKIHVVDPDGRKSPARVVRHDYARDLAVLETDLKLEPASIGDSSAARPGQLVFAVGNPMGQTGAVTMGMIHAVGPLGPRTGRRWIQADVHLAPGNSGGMLATAEGQVIGINTMIFNGLGLAIPSNEAGAFAAGDEDRVRLGVEMIPVAEGLVVVAIERGSLAERAGMVVGDVLRAAPEELLQLLAGAKRAGVIEIPALRGGQPKKLRVHTAQEARAA
jgi:serine protease Do